MASQNHEPENATPTRCTVQTVRHSDEFAEHHFHFPGGERLVAAEYGARADIPAIYMHGFLGSRLEPAAALRALGNVIAFDRPGYGCSSVTRLSLDWIGQRFASSIDALNIEFCRLIGVSAGGPYAATTALALGDRALHLSLVCALADPTAINDGTAGAILMVARYMRTSRLVLPTLIRQMRRSGLDRRFVHWLMRYDLAALREVQADRVAERLYASFSESTRFGSAGMFIDLGLLSRPWDIDPRRIATPTLVLEGAADKVVGRRQGHWWLTNLPAADHHLVPDENHVSLVINHAIEIASGVWPNRRAPA